MISELANVAVSFRRSDIVIQLFYVFNCLYVISELANVGVPFRRSDNLVQYFKYYF